MSSNPKMQIGIYKIDSDIELIGEGELFDKISSLIISGGYENQIIEANPENIELKLLYKKEPRNPKWKTFLKEITKDQEPVSMPNKSSGESFVLLIKKTSNNQIYAIAGGQGYFAIQDFIDQNFGMNIISRLIHKEDKIIKSTKEKSVMGGIIGATKYFRKTYNLFENDNFGKIYQELQTEINKEILIDKFGFSEIDLKKGTFCIAKSSFKIQKSITMEELFKIIEGCEFVLANFEPTPINNLEKLIKKKNISLISNLQNELINQLWRRYKGRESYEIDFDLCHKDFEKYLTASKYMIRKGTSERNFLKGKIFETLDSVDSLFEAIKEIEQHPNNIDEFEKLFDSLKLYSYDTEDNILTYGWLKHHIHGDVEYEGKRYFYIDNTWYLIKDEFIDRLNEGCHSFIKKHKNNKITKAWNYPLESENDFNKKHIGDENVIVLDKVTPENIEACDLLHWENNKLYLFHVKAGFGNTMRDLCSQIIIAANKIQQDLVTGKNYIKSLYKTLEGWNGSTSQYSLEASSQTSTLSEDEFIKLFDKNLVFVLAILDTANHTRDLENISEFRSNIAKFSLQELVKEMKGIEMDFEIIQISKP